MRFIVTHHRCVRGDIVVDICATRSLRVRLCPAYCMRSVPYSQCYSSSSSLSSLRWLLHVQLITLNLVHWSRTEQYSPVVTFGLISRRCVGGGGVSRFRRWMLSADQNTRRDHCLHRRQLWRTFIYAPPSLPPSLPMICYIASRKSNLTVDISQRLFWRFRFTNQSWNKDWEPNLS